MGAVLRSVVVLGALGCAGLVGAGLVQEGGDPESAATPAAPEVPADWGRTTSAFDLPTDLLAASWGDESETRVIEVTGTVALSADAAWKLWSTSEGVAGWLTGFDEETGSPNCVVEPHLGGRFELHFASQLPDGYRGSEGCRVLAYVPGRMLAFSWNAPPYFADIRNEYTQVVVFFDEQAGEDGSVSTEVTLVHHGWPESAFVSDEAVDPKGHAAVFGYFSNAWGGVMSVFETEGPAAAEKLGLE